MKNKEKYIDEIMEALIDGLAIDRRSGSFNGCRTMICDDCLFLKNGIPCVDIKREWLERECQEPQVDWAKVEVDTPILVSSDNEHWSKRYFAKHEDEKVYAWGCGATSWSATTVQDVTEWKYAKLAEKGVER